MMEDEGIVSKANHVGKETFFNEKNYINFFLINFNNIKIGFTKKNIINNLNSINSFIFIWAKY